MLRFFRSIIPENFKLFEQHLFSTVFEKYCENIMENLIYMNSVSMAALTQINCQFVVKNASSDRSGSTLSFSIWPELQKTENSIFDTLIEYDLIRLKQLTPCV